MPDSIIQDKYGPNVWLIDEMYRQYLENPDSVADSWREFFTDYQPNSLNSDAIRAEKPQPVEKKQPEKPVPAGFEYMPLRGFAARIVENMESSLTVPTATSTRIIPVKVMEENRRVINQFLADTRGGKVSFTHLIAWAILQAGRAMPSLTTSYMKIDGVPTKIIPEYINFGLAVDVERKDGSRSLLVPNIKNAGQYDFSGFFAAYNEMLRRVKTNSIEPDDFINTTLSLTNPGMIGTVHSVPRLMSGQAAILATGAIDYPAEYQSADPRIIARLGISKVMTMTCTYDHRVIQGAESGLFLQKIHLLLSGEDNFYEGIYSSLKIPYQAVRLQRDINPIFEGDGQSDPMFEKQARVLQLINLYRVRGHLVAHTNPLDEEVKIHSELDPELYGLSLWDYDREFSTLGLAGRPRMKLREVIDTLREAYCRSIGIEYMHIQDPAQKVWVQQRVEGVKRSEWVSADTKRRILYKLNAAEAFENFLHTKFVGHKRFSLEGSEILIPALDHLLNKAADDGNEEVVLGMAHRGRLNVLANIIGKSYHKIFREFDGDIEQLNPFGSGDVKYHLGANGIHSAPSGAESKLTLAPNPSHLEAVDPVVEGMVRALQDSTGDVDHEKVLAVLVHGDAAFAGQGVVAETFNLSALHGYQTGGTVHIVVNNGIGFTTSPTDARSSVYATDVAKMVQAPIFHVNGEDPEAVIRVVELAMAFRTTFRKDVVIDLICYRRHGHNEGDDPSFTQPAMYARIKSKRSIRKMYTEKLVNRGDLTLVEAEKALEEYRGMLDHAFDDTRESAPAAVSIPEELVFVKPEAQFPTAISDKTLEQLLTRLTTFPDDFTVHPKLGKQIAGRRKMVEDNKIDWALGEAFAIGSLLLEGHPVRLSGQDSRRGTFSQRHLVLVDYKTSQPFNPLANISNDQAQMMVFDSLLSEYAVLGFEFGYSVIRKNALVMWEAQFGDFVNGAQIIIDQFISSSEDKWGQTSRVVMLLPHGFEGQGPEHSSARLERFLALCAEGNMRVTVPTTSAQYFHLLRNQAQREKSTPLIVLTPKSLLRADVAKSSKQDFLEGGFNVLLEEPNPPEKVNRLIFCSGKVAFDLIRYRDEKAIHDTAIIRLEQLYPFPFDQISALFDKYPDAKDIRWVQEEPRNMGAWNFTLARFREIIRPDQKLNYIGRLPSGSPASGSFKVHEAEQNLLVRQAFAR